MPFDGNGAYTPLTPPYPAVSGATIFASDWNSAMNDLATALSNCLTRDGQSALLANLDIANFDLLNAKATTPASSTTGKQVQTSAGVDAKITAALDVVGTFTPTVRGSTTAGTFNQLAQTYGSYVKHGKLVFIHGLINYNALSGTGQLQIGGLPFAAIDQPVITLGATNLTFTGQLVGKLNGSLIDVNSISSGGAITGVAVDATALLFFAGCYQTA